MPFTWVTIVGIAAGLVAAPLLAHFYDGIELHDEVRASSLAGVFALLGGGTLAALPMGEFVLQEEVIAQYVVGWAIPILPAGTILYVYFWGERILRKWRERRR